MRIVWILLLPGALLAAAVAYLPGLWGPFLLDDYNNLEPLRLWQDGVITWRALVFGNESGPLGRPLSMATFLLNAALAGLAPWHYKAFNLILHLVAGVLVAGFTHRMLRLDERLRPHAWSIAVLLACWWLLLPIHTATVLYVVQRMTQLAALFVIGGLWLYLVARERVASGRGYGMIMLFLGIPALTVAGALCKENALLLPLLCAVVEFGMPHGGRRPKTVTWFLATIVGLPALAVLVMLAWEPGIVLGGFERRSFTLWERLLTESRVLWGYVQQILLPAASNLSLFQDDVVQSRGLLQPVTTLLSIAAWLGALAGAWLARHRAPLVLTGLLLFLGGHLMESSVFALELAFLHRNYMPSVGILVAVAGVAALLLDQLPRPTRKFRRMAVAVLALAGVVLWSATNARSWIWQSELTLVSHQLENNPDSVRGRLMAAELAMGANETGAALHQIELAAPHLADRERGVVPIWRMAAYCGTGQAIPATLVPEFRHSGDKHIARLEREAFANLTGLLEREACPLDNLEQIASAALYWLRRADQPDRVTEIWRFRYNTARLMARAGEIEEAFPIAVKAFRDSGYEFPVGVFAFQLATSRHDFDKARDILKDLRRVENPGDRRQRRAIEQFQAHLERIPGRET